MKDKIRDEKPSARRQSRKEERRQRRRDTFTLWGRIGTGLFDGFRRILKTGPIGRFLTSYDRFEEAAKSSFVATMPREALNERRKKKYRPKREIGTEGIDGSLAIYNPATLRQPLSRRFSRLISENRLLCGLIRGIAEIARAPVSALGTFVFSMGVSCVLAQILSFLSGTGITDVIGQLICGFLLLLLSVPVISRNNVSLSRYVLTSRFGYRILTPMLGLADEIDPNDRDEVRQPGWINIFAALIGLTCGGLTFLFPLSSVALVVLVTVAFVLTVWSPELGLNLILILLPLARLYPGGQAILAGYTVFTAAAFLLAVLRGKRVMRFEAFDFAILIFAAFLICSELFMPGNYARQTPILLIVCCVLLYFLAKNLFRDRARIVFCMGGLITASFTVSLIGIAQALYTRTWTGISSVFDTPQELSAYLLLTVLLSVGSFRYRGLRTLALALTLIAQLTCLILTGTWVWLPALFLAFLLYLGLSGRRMFSALLLILLCLPMTLPLLPDAAVNRIGAFLLWRDPIQKGLIQTWKNVLPLCRQGFLGGIGLSAENFAARYAPAAAGSSVPSASCASSLWLDLLICTGILGLILFLIVILLFLRQSFTFYSRFGRASDGVGLHQALFCSLAALLIGGFFLSPLSSPVNACLFWSMIGLALATKDAVVRECTSYQREMTETEGEIVLGYR